MTVPSGTGSTVLVLCTTMHKPHSHREIEIVVSFGKVFEPNKATIKTMHSSNTLGWHTFCAVQCHVTPHQQNISAIYSIFCLMLHSQVKPIFPNLLYSHIILHNFTDLLYTLADAAAHCALFALSSCGRPPNIQWHTQPTKRKEFTYQRLRRLREENKDLRIQKQN